MGKTVTVIDPASGWQYGFPKVLPDDVVGKDAIDAWLLEQGYPEKFLKYPKRFWEAEE